MRIERNPETSELEIKPWIIRNGMTYNPERPLNEFSLYERRVKSLIFDFINAIGKFIMVYITIVTLVALFFDENTPNAFDSLFIIAVLATPVIICICLVFFRDIRGRSYGKYIYRLIIVSTEGDEKPTIKQLILRNLIQIPFVDSGMIRKYGIKYGDKIAKTKVVEETYIPPEILEDEDDW